MATWADIQGHWAQACIEFLVEKALIAGYPDATFRPEAAVSRAEFAVLLTKVWPRPPQRPGRSFRDVSNQHWAASAIQSAYRSGWLSGYPNQRFQPDQAISRVQALIAVAAGLGYPLQPSATSMLTQALADAQAIPAYAQAWVVVAIAHQLVVNYPHRRILNPNRAATRAEIAALVCQALTQSTQESSLVPATLIAGAVTPTEIRGVWLTNVDSQVLFSRTALAAALTQLADHRFTTVYPTVWNWGYTLYPSAVAERVIGAQQGLYPDTENQGRNQAQETAQGNRDLLLELIELAQPLQLKVIPWLEFGLMAPARSALVERHPNWLTQRRDGSRIDTQDNGKHDRVWLNPFHPEVQQFILDLVSELMANYAVDGLQLDDHFGLPVEFGYDPYTQQRYQQTHGGRIPPANAADPTWIRWRADQLTQFWKRLFVVIKARRPQAILSLSPSPAGFAYQHFLQDWPTWERQGYVEELVVQLYRRNLESFLPELDKPELKAARNHIPTVIGILAGVKDAPTPATLIEQQVQAARSRGYGGIAFFYYDSIWQARGESTVTRTAMVRSLFSP